MQTDSNLECPAGETSPDAPGRERELEMAEAELVAARGALKAAETDIENAAHKIEALIEEEKHPHQFKAKVIYNGVPKLFEVRRDELVKRLLDEAKQAFGPINNAHLLGLFNKAGVELKDDQTIEAAGVKPDDVLLLRPSSVRGG